MWWKACIENNLIPNVLFSLKVQREIGGTFMCYFPSLQGKGFTGRWKLSQCWNNLNVEVLGSWQNWKTNLRDLRPIMQKLDESQYSFTKQVTNYLCVQSNWKVNKFIFFWIVKRQLLFKVIIYILVWAS